MPRSWVLRTGATVLVLLGGLKGPEAGGEYVWQHDPATPGDWFDPANWEVTADHGSDRIIGNDGTATVSYGSVDVGTVYIGWGNGGSIVQSGSSTFSASIIYMWLANGRPARYTLNDSATLNCMNMFAWGGAPVEFIQNGGTNNTNKVEFSTGVYQLRGGLIAPVLISVGDESQFIQTGGSIERAYPSASVMVYDGGTFRLEDGVINLGHIYVRGGRFTQNGGAVTLVGTKGLQIYNDGNIYSITGGSLTVKAGIAVGLPRTGYTGTGELSIADGRPTISVGSLQLHPAAVLTAGAGSAIRVNGPAVDNQSTDEAALAGLGNLDLIVEGTGPTTLEAAGKDLGAVTAGFHRNFSLARLHLGGANPGQVRLVDAFDNQPALPEAEALYVTSLDLSAGSQLDLNGLHLYYITARIDPLATIIGGAPTPVAALPGDADLDGTADFADYQTMEANFGDATTFGWAHGDFDGDGDVDFTDYQMLEANFGQSVPEPVSLWLLGMGGAGLLASGRKRASGSGTDSSRK